MTNTIMRTQVMRMLKTPTITGLALGLVLSACGSTTIPSSHNAGGEENEMLPGENKPNAEQIIPKEAKRQISADARADFEKATQRYLAAKKSGGLSGSECRSVASAFKSAADENPALLEARFNQGAVLNECGDEDAAAKVWDGMKYGPAIANLGYIAWKNGDTSKAESLFTRAIDVDPLHTVEARNNLAQIQRDKARRAEGAEKKQYIQSAVSNLRTVLAIDSNNLQAFSTLAFIYYDMNMLEMAKLVGNQAIKKADEIATGKFEEEKGEKAGAGDEGEAKGKGKGKKGKGDKKDDDEPGVKAVDVREAGTGVTPEMKKQLAIVRNTLGLVELKKKNISPAIKQFKEAVVLDPTFAEARLNLAALSLNNRDYTTAEENFREALKMQPKNYEAAIGLGVALRGNKKIDDAESQYVAAQKLDSANPSSYYNLGLLYQDYKDGQKPSLHKAQDYYRQFLSHANGSTPGGLTRDAEKRIKDIDEIYVALDEAAKMQAEAEEMQKKAEEQQKQMEEQMKKQEAEEKAAAEKAKGGDKGGAAKPADGKPGTEPPAATPPPAPGTEGAGPADGGKKSKKSKK